MALTRRVELLPLERTASGNALFSHAQPSDETLIADLAPISPSRSSATAARPTN